MRLDEIYLNEELSNRLFAILEARNSDQTAQELAKELLETAIDTAYFREVQGYK